LGKFLHFKVALFVSTVMQSFVDKNSKQTLIHCFLFPAAHYIANIQMLCDLLLFMLFVDYVHVWFCWF